MAIPPSTLLPPPQHSLVVSRGVSFPRYAAKCSLVAESNAISEEVLAPLHRVFCHGFLVNAEKRPCTKSLPNKFTSQDTACRYDFLTIDWILALIRSICADGYKSPKFPLKALNPTSTLIFALGVVCLPSGRKQQSSYIERKQTGLMTLRWDQSYGIRVVWCIRPYSSVMHLLY